MITIMMVVMARVMMTMKDYINKTIGIITKKEVDEKNTQTKTYSVHMIHFVRQTHL